MVNLTDVGITIKKVKAILDLPCPALAQESLPELPLLFGGVPTQFDLVGAASDPADCMLGQEEEQH